MLLVGITNLATLGPLKVHIGFTLAASRGGPQPAKDMRLGGARKRHTTERHAAVSTYRYAMPCNSQAQL